MADNKKNSGINSLIDALRQSGVDFDRGEKPFGASETPSSSESSGGAGSSGGGGPEGPTVEFAFVENIASWGKKALLGLAIIIVLVGLASYWWFHPPISINSVDTWSFVGLFILVPSFLVFWSRSITYKKGTAKVKKNEAKANKFKMLSFLPVAVVIVGLLGSLLSASFFPGNAAKYASILEPDTLKFSEDIKEVNYSEIPIIDHDSAELLGNRAMGSIPEYVSQFEVSSLYSQINFEETPVRISPLGYADIFKWWANRGSGIPAYALVDMTNQDAEIVRLGDEGIRYSESEPLARNIHRYVQLKHPFYIFDEKSFEVDESGNPWWICPVKKFTIGLFGGQTISRVVLCDAITGECQDLAVEDCPEWVDRVFPADLLVQQYNWHGAYSSGWLNSWLGQKGVVQTTPGTNNMAGYNYIAKDDDVWMYSGVTSATADSSIVGFVLVNQRTAEAHFYSVPGATEDSAMRSAEGQVQHLNYDATFPILININGQPTYFMALKDQAGLVKMFAMLDIQRYQNVAVGDTVAKTQEAYVQMLAVNGVIDKKDIEDSVNFVELEGVIESIGQAVIDGNTHFYVKLEGSSKVYEFALPELLEIVLYETGDTISFKYIESDSINIVDSINSDLEIHSSIQKEEDEGGPVGDMEANSAEGAEANPASV